MDEKIWWEEFKREQKKGRGGVERGTSVRKEGRGGKQTSHSLVTSFLVQLNETSD